MCGLFGFAGNSPADPDTIDAAAVLASYRGPHGHGWSALGSDGASSNHACTGLLRPSCEQSIRSFDTRRLIGHARLATSGGPDSLRDAADLQPRHGVRFQIVHNGNIYGSSCRIDTDDLLTSMETQDTGAIERDIARGLGDVEHRERYAAIVMTYDGTIYAVRMWQPLYATTRREGTYLTSGMLGPDSELLPEFDIHLIGGPLIG